MDAAQFMLLLNLLRTLAIAALLAWLIFTSAKLPKVRVVCASALMALLGSNITAVLVAVVVYKVPLW